MKHTINRRNALSMITAGALLASAGSAHAARKNASLLSAYLDAWKQKDVRAIIACLSDDVHFTAPNAETRGRTSYEEATARFLRIVERVDVRARFVSGNRAMIAWNFVCIDPIGTSATAELLSIKDGRIADTQVFFDTAPFAAFARAQQLKPKAAQ